MRTILAFDTWFVTDPFYPLVVTSHSIATSSLLILPAVGKNINAAMEQASENCFFCFVEKEPETAGIGLDFNSSSLRAMSCCFSRSSSFNLASMLEMSRNLSERLGMRLWWFYQRLCRNAQALMQFPDHLQSQRAFVIENLVNSVAFSDHGLQIFNG